MVKKPIYGGYGLIAENGLPKPSFNAFKLLHRLGDRRIAISSHSALATKRSNGTVVMALWNQSSPDTIGNPKQFKVSVKGLEGNHSVVISRLDSTHGSLLRAFDAMGKPSYPTREQIKQLRRAAALPPPETMAVHQGQIALVLPPQGLALVEFH